MRGMPCAGALLPANSSIRRQQLVSRLAIQFTPPALPGAPSQLVAFSHISRHANRPPAILSSLHYTALSVAFRAYALPKRMLLTLHVAGAPATMPQATHTTQAACTILKLQARSFAQLREAALRDNHAFNGHLPMEHDFRCHICGQQFRVVPDAAVDVVVANGREMQDRGNMVCGGCSRRSVLADVAALTA